MKAVIPSDTEGPGTGLSNCDLARRLLESYKADGVHCQPGRALPSPPEVLLILQLVRELLLPGSTGIPQPACVVLHSFVEGRIAELRVNASRASAEELSW